MFNKLKSYFHEMLNHESNLTSTVYYLTKLIKIDKDYYVFFIYCQGNIRQIVIESGNLIKTITYKNLPRFFSQDMCHEQKCTMIVCFFLTRVVLSFGYGK